MIKSIAIRQLVFIALITFGIVIYRSRISSTRRDLKNYLIPDNKIDQSFPVVVGQTLFSRITKKFDGGDVEPILVLVIASKRPIAIRNHLQQLLRNRPSVSQFPIVVSQDGVDVTTTNTIKEFINSTNNVTFMHHSNRKAPITTSQKEAKNYFFIAQHYKWALDKVFKETKFEQVIVTEEDLDIAEDFFSYFTATRKLLKSDPTIWCISAWNDNGATDITDRNRVEQLYRTDFFPGLGWMLTRELWRELSASWPEAYWDDWLRQQRIRKNRVCIRPEISRTAHNNKVAGKGSSGGLYKKYLASIHLPDHPIHFSLLDLSYLIKVNYDSMLGKRLHDAKVITLEDIKKKAISQDNSYIVFYRNPREYRQLAKAVGLMIDIRSGMPRTAYYGIVSFFFAGSRIYAVHANFSLDDDFSKKNSSEVYDEDWDKMSKFLDFQQMYCTPSKFSGKCDPKSKEMHEWFKSRKILKRLEVWGDMIVN
uniref:Alpha-1,3-mannosyl-glycoprotein 2-beta-N-acetylglucosaminyltransferase n=1 Tax=Syphacia muris TaxID=451379 RepID=A0A0N5AZE7_9BILA